MQSLIVTARRAASSLVASHALLSSVFAAIMLIALMEQAYTSWTLVRTSQNERAGSGRLRDARELLTVIMHRENSHHDGDDLQLRVERVLSPYPGEAVVDPFKTQDVLRTWRVVAKDGRSDAALGALGLAVAHLMLAISDASGLTYDNDNDVINLGDMYALHLPVASARIAQAAALGLDVSKSFGFGDRTAIGKLVAQADVSWSTVAGDFAAARLATTADFDPLVAAHAGAVRAFARLETRLDALVVTPSSNVVAALPRDYRDYEAATTIFDDEIDRVLDRLIVRRITRETGRIVLLLVLCILIVGLTAFSQSSRGMLDRERRAKQAEKDRAIALEHELERRRVERASVLNEAQFRTVFDVSPLGIATIDRNGKFVERNPAMIAMLDRSFQLFDRSFDAQMFARLLASDAPPHQLERRLESASGARWIDLTVFPIHISESESIAAIAMIADVTERKASSEQLHYDATHDALTGLLTRGAFLDQARGAVEGGDPRRTRAIVMIDLDRFKFVNDTFGHAAGDDVLVTVANRLRAIVRVGDIVARLHGDEFAMLVTTASVKDVDVIAERVLHALRAPVSIDGRAICIDSSIGICMVEDERRSAEELVHHADTAMYHAKRIGRGRFVYFNDAMHVASAKYTRLASDIRGGLERGEFGVAYQPIVALGDASIRGFEALLRWRHPELGEISPIEFIAIAEETGAIGPLGNFVLREALAQVARWDRQFPAASPVSMSVNLSACQLDDRIVDDVEGALRAAGVAGSRLILELTESALLESGPQMIERITGLRATGARTCLDDFGTGYSSLRYLQQFPIDYLKIDRSFVGGSDGGIASEPIVRMLINLAESLGIGVIAEGIETAEQHDALIALGCRYGQGYRFCAARPPSEIDFEASLDPRSLRCAPTARALESTALSA